MMDSLLEHLKPDFTGNPLSRRGRRNSRKSRRQTQQRQKAWSPELRLGMGLFSFILLNLGVGLVGSLL